MSFPSTDCTRSVVLIAAALGLSSAAVGAQADYYNTDAGRPIRVQDAYAIEHRGLELQVTPLRLERASGGLYRWGFEPAIEYGMLPRTQLEVGFPLAWIDASASSRRSGLAGVDISVLHTLNVETDIPALAIAADVLLPVGNLAAAHAYPSVTGIVTRTFSRARVHINTQYTFGEAPNARSGAALVVGGQVLELSRWMGGVAVDHTVPLNSTLISAEVYAQGGLADASDVTWNSSVGARYQLSPRWVIDGGLGRRLNGADQTWSVTFGGAYAFGMRWRP